MKISDFISELCALSQKAKQRLRKWLKETKGPHCPITQVARVKLGSKYVPCDFTDAAEELKLPEKIACRIVNAADCKGDTKYLCRTEKRYRKLMVKAVAK